MPPHLHIDYESFSLADLKAVGSYRYSNDPSTEILCCAMALGNGEPVVWHPRMSDRELSALDPYFDALEDPEVLVYAHNAMFEIAMSLALMKKTWGIDPPALSRWRCTMSLAQRASLPASLEKLSEALNDSRKTINVGRVTSGGVLKGIFGNRIVEKEVSEQYREYFTYLKVAHTQDVEWLREELQAGAILFCPGCPPSSPTCHARIIEQELGVKPQSLVKDKRGKALIKKFSMMQPGKRISKKNPQGTPPYRLRPEDDPAAFAEFMAYCAQDVRAEQEVARRLAYFDEPINNANYTLDQIINARGVPVNLAALRHAQNLIDEETEIVSRQFRELVGLDITQTAKILAWAQANGYDRNDLQAATVEEWLEETSL